MAKKFKITESQYKQMLGEGVAIQAQTNSQGTVDGDSLKKTAQEVKSDPNIKNTPIEVDPNKVAGAGNSSMFEHRLITKKELQTNRLRYLKENSEVLSLNNFMKKLH